MIFATTSWTANVVTITMRMVVAFMRHVVEFTKIWFICAVIVVVMKEFAYIEQTIVLPTTKSVIMCLPAVIVLFVIVGMPAFVVVFTAIAVGTANVIGLFAMA